MLDATGEHSPIEKEGSDMPGVGIGVFLLAVGAVLTFAVTAEAEGFDVGTVGVILMIVGGLAVVLSMLFWSTWFGPARREERVIRDDHHTHESH